MPKRLSCLEPFCNTQSAPAPKSYGRSRLNHSKRFPSLSSPIDKSNQIVVVRVLWIRILGYRPKASLFTYKKPWRAQNASNKGRSSCRCSFNATKCSLNAASSIIASPIQADRLFPRLVACPPSRRTCFRIGCRDPFSIAANSKRPCHLTTRKYQGAVATNWFNDTSRHSTKMWVDDLPYSTIVQLSSESIFGTIKETSNRLLPDSLPTPWRWRYPTNLKQLVSWEYTTFSSPSGSASSARRILLLWKYSTANLTEINRKDALANSTFQIDHAKNSCCYFSGALNIYA